ncbi:TonB-linked SusC/RagA family outer membrane protein [Dyadobacter jejuensis]|uniref:TonB-linked SusC/RagA family outer membrane protein n=1 Tax=Dyadobacter jejuensis TaxID=1082580 RepID=A0A316AK31_9BACT|nr:TonB-dependent receptor [Dyadobacter jejuensis]PWJ57882.1 TonB-linked SusC/RagA family outer membrane protein [Dyadobacter jejuensis]
MKIQLCTSWRAIAVSVLLASMSQMGYAQQSISMVAYPTQQSPKPQPATIALQEALMVLSEHFNTDLLFADKNLEKVFIKTDLIDYKKSIEENLQSILSTTNLTFKKLKKNTYLIVTKAPNVPKMKSPQGTVTEHVSMTAQPVIEIQDIEIKGTVTDDQGEGLPGVNIALKGTTQGVISQANGAFTIQVPNTEAILVFSYVGFLSKEIVVGNRTTLAITLLPDDKSLEELVVVGYGTQKKSDVTGAVSSISEEKIQSRPVTGFNDALQGRSGGVQVRQSGGDLSGKFNISIRGTGSVTGNNDPLIVVDGVPLFSTNFSTINPQDIASMDILKDASATAIYGARAANGVIIITTKQGKAGKTRFSFNTDLGFEEITKRYDVMSTEEQRLLFLEGFKNANRDLSVYNDPTNPVWQTDTDWQKLGTRTGFRQNYNLGFSGGSEKNIYSGSVSYLNRKGVLAKTDLQSWSLRLNLQSKVNDWLTITSNLSGSYQDQNIQNNDSWGAAGYRGLVYQHSYTVPYDEFGNLSATNTTSAPFFGANENPLVDLLLPTRESNVTRLLGNVKFDFQLAPSLKLSANAGADVVNGADFTYLPVYQVGIYNRPEGITTEGSDKQINWVTDAFLTYNKNINEHAINAVGGVSLQQFYNKSNSITGRGTIDNALNQLSNQTSFIGTGTTIVPGLASGFLRVNYGYKGKYLVTATVRRDGSSRFGPENKFGTFPSASFAWRLSEEDFMKNSRLFHDVKLRASYGLTGNQNIGNFAFITRAVAATYVSGNTLTIGNAPQNIGNPNLKWETAKQLDFGVDFSMFGGRINSTIDFYDKRSQDLLVATPIALTAGVDVNPILNIGSLKNTGVEFAITTRNVRRKNFSWDTDFNITYNKNKVLDIGTNSIGNPLTIPGELIPLSNQPTNLTRSGHPVGAFYMYEFAGIWQLGEEEEAKKWANAVPGDPKYTDTNGNGIFDEGDKIDVGNPHPKLFGGIDNTLSYGPFSLSVFLNYSVGNKLYNTARNLFSRSVPFVQNFAEVNDFWTVDNPSNSVPRPSQGGNTTTLATLVSTRFLENADFLRVKNVSITYKLPSTWLNGVALEGAQIALSGTNLLTFTKYTGLDPEASSRTSLLSAGIDYTPYPLTRLFSMSIKANF